MEKKDKKIKKKATNSVLVKENKDLKTELNKYKDEKLRLMADFENLKKRKNDEISNLIKYSGESLIISLIPIFNDLDRILKELDSRTYQLRSLIDWEKFIQGV